MTAFVIVAALLTVATLVLVSRPLLRSPRAARTSADELNAAIYRDQLAELDAQLAEGALDAAHHARAREAIRHRLTQELHPAAGPPRNAFAQRSAAIVVAIGIAAGAAGLYPLIGTPTALGPTASPAAVSGKDGAHGLQNAQIAGMVERLAARLRDNPEDLNGWVMLARSYSALGRFDDAGRAYGEGAKRAPGDAVLLADYADTLAMAQGRSFDGEPDRLIARALEIDRGHVKALALAGSSAFARKDFARAIGFWSRIREQVPADSQMARSIEASIAEARQLAGAPRQAKAIAVTSSPPPAAAQPARVSGTVTLAPALAARAKDGDMLLIFARTTAGSRMPVAILRAPVGRWPVAFTLDDSSAMSLANRLSTHAEIVLEARISRSGSAAAAPGDLHGTLAPVKVGASGVVIEIASVVE